MLDSGDAITGSAEIERISVNTQLHFTRAIVRTLVERLELANTRVAQTTR